MCILSIICIIIWTYLQLTVSFWSCYCVFHVYISLTCSLCNWPFAVKLACK
jgi:hypothetical protein